MFEKICIIGCGLIGSSILRDVYNSKISKSVTVFDNSREVIEIIKKEIYAICLKRYSIRCEKLRSYDYRCSVERL